MTDQLVRCNKSQDFSSKKNAVNNDLSKTENIELDADRKVKLTIKYASTALHVN